MAKEQAETGRETRTPDDDALRCVVCAHRITERAYRQDRSGAHEHTFVNPAGFTFQIGCFLAAPGCAHVGPTSEAFSWFPGWSWQVAICSRCRAHVGWIFRCGGEQFHGLIIAALR
ncbi:MAG TPA: cereblon family protein [Kofleriaceae bacterium]|nr:cereblon family protein [Kofleriaceae bacterium]